MDRAAPFDLVLADVPCSGSGSWRRAPEAKWALTPERLAELRQLQAAILDRAAGLVAPGGYLAYATCSLLKQENADQIAAFRTRAPEWRQVGGLCLTPLQGGDGFFLAVLTRILTLPQSQGLINLGLTVFSANGPVPESDGGNTLTSAATATRHLFGSAQGLSPRVWLLIVAAVVCGTVSMLAPDREMRLAAAVAGMSLCFLAILLRGLVAFQIRRDAAVFRRLGMIVQDDAAPCFTTDTDGQIRFQNAAAAARFGPRDGQTLLSALSDHFRQPRVGAFPSSKPGWLLWGLRARMW